MTKVYLDKYQAYVVVKDQLHTARIPEATGEMIQETVGSTIVDHDMIPYKELKWRKVPRGNLTPKSKELALNVKSVLDNANIEAIEGTIAVIGSQEKFDKGGYTKKNNDKVRYVPVSTKEDIKGREFSSFIYVGGDDEENYALLLNEVKKKVNKI